MAIYLGMGGGRRNGYVVRGIKINVAATQRDPSIKSPKLRVIYKKNLFHCRKYMKKLLKLTLFGRGYIWLKEGSLSQETYRICTLPPHTRRRSLQEQFCWQHSSRITEIHTFRPNRTESSFSQEKSIILFKKRQHYMR